MPLIVLMTPLVVVDYSDIFLMPMSFSTVHYRDIRTIPILPVVTLVLTGAIIIIMSLVVSAAIARIPIADSYWFVSIHNPLIIPRSIGYHPNPVETITPSKHNGPSKPRRIMAIPVEGIGISVLSLIAENDDPVGTSLVMS
jgi:hypothetical protein